jgi:decaprenyl-phosphate phosphoribosyltransferase
LPGDDSPAASAALSGARRAKSSRPAGALLRIARPRQWTKSVLVFAAPAAADVLTHTDALLRTCAAAVLFIAASSGIYCVNDLVDVEADRAHPAKRARPLAAGEVSAAAAVTLAAMLLLGSLAASALVTWKLTIVIGIYIAAQLSYSAGLKREPVVELVIVASGFVLRMVAGGVAADVPLSSWFLAVAGGGALLVVTGKRLAELMQFGGEAVAPRVVLGEYTLVFLQLVVGICGAVVIVVYALWAFDPETESRAARVLAIHLSTVPFLIAVLRYVLEAERGAGGAPEDVFLRHRVLQILGIAWVAMLLIGVTGG